jgi:hypothetical protein
MAESYQILYPAFAMFALVGLVLANLARKRVGAVGRGEMQVGYYKTFQGDDEPEHIRVVTRNFLNLFEVPVLFYVVLILTYVTRQQTAWMVGCAWAYVALRYAHSFVHLSSNDVLLRFRLYFASNFVLLVLWGSLLVRLLSNG